MTDEHIQTKGGPTQQDVAVLAYRIYLQEGCPSGRQAEHWAMAEATLMREHQRWMRQQQDMERRRRSAIERSKKKTAA